MQAPVFTLQNSLWMLALRHILAEPPESYGGLNQLDHIIWVISFPVKHHQEGNCSCQVQQEFVALRLQAYIGLYRPTYSIYAVTNVIARLWHAQASALITKIKQCVNTRTNVGSRHSTSASALSRILGA